MNNSFEQHGAFSWFELMTTDTEAAKTFYGQLFGWEMEDTPLEDTTYSVIKVGKQEVGGIMSTAVAQVQGSPPSHWGVYVTVSDVEQTATKAQELGAKILVPPTDIPDVGRFAVLQDPQGAVLSVITYKNSSS
jgi:hypothetical protein